MLLTFCLALSTLTLCGAIGAENDLTKAPRFALNLDLPETDRWTPILKHYDAEAYRKVVGNAMSHFLSDETQRLLAIVGGAVEKYLPSPYAGEIKGIANYFKMDIGDILIFNIFYDLYVSGGCTSIVAQDSHGNIWHGRNLDYFMTSTFRNLTLVVDFQSNGKTLYTTTAFLGQTGMYTGQRPNAFTISLNQRNEGSKAENAVQVLKALIANGTAFTSFQIRDAISRDNNFHEALDRLAYRPQTAPDYFIIGGNRSTEGAVITRNRSSEIDIWYLNSTIGRWFVLETNYDHWLLPPKSDDRRDPGMIEMNEIGQDAINTDGLLKVLSTKFVCNARTAYTTLMSAAYPDVYVTYLRYCT